MLRVVLFYAFLLLIFTFLMIKSLVRSNENEYVAIFRLGKLLGVLVRQMN